MRSIKVCHQNGIYVCVFVFQGIQKQLSRVRRPDQGHPEELVPLALTADDSHEVMLDHTTKNNDAFETPPSSPETPDVFANGDLYMEKVPDDKVETRCGYWQCHPDALQKCNNPNALLLFLCCFSMAQGLYISNGTAQCLCVYDVNACRHVCVC